MAKYLIIGGVQREGSVEYEYHRYKKGIMLKYDTNSGDCETVFSHVTPPEYCSDDNPSILFKSADLVGDRLFLCTQTELLIVNVHDYSIAAHISHPWFNDVHHVRLTSNDTLLVANTGLDMVMELNFDGELINQWGVADTPTWDRFDENEDYRKIATTKPHESHPNFVFEYEGEYWVTRFSQRDAVCLNDTDNKISNISEEGIHDGVVYEDKIYFTSVDGKVMIHDLKNKQQLAKVDLNTIDKSDYSLGWCRGISRLDEDNFVVGFSRLRETTWKENVRWIKHKMLISKFPPVRPARITCFNSRLNSMVWELNVEDYGMGEIFSIFKLPEKE